MIFLDIQKTMLLSQDPIDLVGYINKGIENFS
jgi:hypothetical protein